jgi:hypothetical protein
MASRIQKTRHLARFFLASSDETAESEVVFNLHRMMECLPGPESIQIVVADRQTDHPGVVIKTIWQSQYFPCPMGLADKGMP